VIIVPKEALAYFKMEALQNGLLPSVALRKMMVKFACPLLDAGVVISLVMVTWPDADFHGSGLRARVVDAAYPNSDVKQFSDQDFDVGIQKMLAQLPNPTSRS
jgi:hypothetical protein